MAELLFHARPCLRQRLLPRSDGTAASQTKAGGATLTNFENPPEILDFFQDSDRNLGNSSESLGDSKRISQYGVY